MLFHELVEHIRQLHLVLRPSWSSDPFLHTSTCGTRVLCLRGDPAGMTSWGRAGESFAISSEPRQFERAGFEGCAGKAGPLELYDSTTCRELWQDPSQQSRRQRILHSRRSPSFRVSVRLHMFVSPCDRSGMGGVAAERVCHALEHRRDGQITWTGALGFLTTVDFGFLLLQAACHPSKWGWNCRDVLAYVCICVCR